MLNDINHFSNEEVILRIINLTEGLNKFWKDSKGWAPINSAELLSRSRLDWQASLARHLKHYLDISTHNESGELILAWTTLGSLVEGTMKLFLSVYYQDYKITYSKIKEKYKEPDELILNVLKKFFSDFIWTDKIRSKWKLEGHVDWIEWISFIQQKRNSIHAYKHRDIGNFEDFFKNLKFYLLFLRELTDRFPYPDDEIYKPRER